jgi:maleylacetate reductase
VPTTYAGSEMTDILGETRDGIKTTQRSPKILPEIVIYDVDLTLDLPSRITATSGMNAIAHAVEALYAADTNPVTQLLAEEGIRQLAGGLPALMDQPRDALARGGALMGAWLCGLCLANASMALHHKLCHVLGGSFGLPHAETHSIVLPHAAAYNALAAPEAMRRVASALGADDAIAGLQGLKQRLVGSLRLADIGLRAEDIDRAADIACSAPYPNPRPLERCAIRALIESAYQGRSP